MNCNIEKKNNKNKRKIKEIMIACFINSLWKFTETLHKTQKWFRHKSEAQVKNFLFDKTIMFCSQDIQVFVFLTI